MAKKILSVILLLSMLVLLPACSKKEETPSVDATDAATEAPDAATEAPTEPVTEAPTEPPTEKETEPPAPPKEYVRETVFKVDFTAMADGDAPFTTNNIDDLRIEGGLLKGTSNGGDPYMNYNGGDCTFPADSVQEIRIKLFNHTADYNFQFFFTTDSVGWSEPASYKYFLDYGEDEGDDNTWNEIVLDVSESDDWAGTITAFRIDPFSTEGDFEIESVEFLSVTEKAG